MKVNEQLADQFPELVAMVKYYSDSSKGKTWDREVTSNLVIVSAEPDKLVYEFLVEESHCNQLGNLHGGCVATLIDICSSFSILVSSSKRWQMMGISTDLSVCYLKGVPFGQTIRIECHAQRVGKTLANLYTQIFDKKNSLCYTGTHSKFNIDSRL